jgi:hypothetical protein
VILVDSSVWIDFFKGKNTPATRGVQLLSDNTANFDVMGFLKLRGTNRYNS